MCAAARSIFFLCPDDASPSGGVRKIYRHVDVLNVAGIDAAVVHKQPGFRPTWFASTTRVIYLADVRPGPADFVVVPEIAGPRLPDLAANCRAVIFNQNAHLSFRGYGIDLSRKASPYTDPRTAAAIVVSEHSRRYLQYAFPQLTIFRIRNGVDPALFHYDPAAKKRSIAFMPRKHPEEALAVINLLRFRGALEGFELLPIHNMSETDAAAALRQSLVFLNFGYPEGFGLPALEAMACGCQTLGYDGFGGAEFFTEEHGFPVLVADTLTFARRAEEVLNQLRSDPAPLLEKASRAATFVQDNFTPQREAESILRAWEGILMPSCVPL